MNRRTLLAALGLTATAGCYTRFLDDSSDDNSSTTTRGSTGDTQNTSGASSDTAQDTAESDDDGKDDDDDEGEDEATNGTETDAENTSDTEPEEIPDHEDVESEGEYEQPAQPTETETLPTEFIRVRSSASTTGTIMTVYIDVRNVSTHDIDTVEFRVTFYENGDRLGTKTVTVDSLREGASATTSAEWDAAENGVRPTGHEVTAVPLDKA